MINIIKFINILWKDLNFLYKLTELTNVVYCKKNKTTRFQS